MRKVNSEEIIIIVIKMNHSKYLLFAHHLKTYRDMIYFEDCKSLQANNIIRYNSGVVKTVCILPFKNENYFVYA
jgi:hypothetical protein